MTDAGAISLFSQRKTWWIAKLLSLFVISVIFCCSLCYKSLGGYFFEQRSGQYHFIVFGGAGDPIHHICPRIISSKIPAESFSYFQWYHFDEASKFIKSIPDSKKIILLGHSWGGQTAVRIFNRFPDRVSVLITLDPVSWNRPALSSKKDILWINVVPEFDRISWNTIVATAGGRWKDQSRAVNVHLCCDHCSVDKMLDVYVSNDKTVWDLVLDRETMIKNYFERISLLWI